MYCSNCGCEISDEDKFCKNCGKKLIEEESPFLQAPAKQPAALYETAGREDSSRQTVWEEKEEADRQEHRKITGILVGTVIAGGVVLMICLACLLLWAQGQASDSLEKWRQGGSGRNGSQEQYEEWPDDGAEGPGHFEWDGF